MNNLSSTNRRVLDLLKNELAKKGPVNNDKAAKLKTRRM